MPQKPTFVIALILASLLLSGCYPFPEEPLLAACDTLACAALQGWRTA
ncbi:MULTISPECIES: hypothetical protein [unclassified Pseudomonas]|nr:MULTISPECIES: hypothetical protein [unclassified Pseudomonas]MEB0047775.1 hypothetical protein [Pseudomonas sp. Dout3]MEB0098266.1 hypothetical protein [Pseudomonas sp. DC1.2]WPX59223.1 hypothetical protein RHM68_00755 [Pseudomonas sp. DC1.2]